MSANLFRRLKDLLPAPQVLVGRVTAHHDDDTSSIELPSSLGLTDVGGNVATGSVIRARGRSVAVGQNAFVRAGVVESQAPGGAPLEIEVGRVTPGCGLEEQEPPAAEPSGWSLTVPPLTALNSPTYGVLNDGRTIWQRADSGFPIKRIETVSTPLQSTGRRFFQISYDPTLVPEGDGYGDPDQFGFASGDIAAAGGVLESLTTPVGILFVVAYNRSFGYWFWWIRQWPAPGSFVDDSMAARSFPEVLPGDRIGWDVDLDEGRVVGVYLNDTRVLPDALSGADLTAWNTYNSWAPNQQGGAQFQQRATFGDMALTLHSTAEDINIDIPAGSAAWDS